MSLAHAACRPAASLRRAAAGAEAWYSLLKLSTGPPPFFGRMHCPPVTTLQDSGQGNLIIFKEGIQHFQQLQAVQGGVQTLCRSITGAAACCWIPAAQLAAAPASGQVRRDRWPGC